MQDEETEGCEWESSCGFESVVVGVTTMSHQTGKVLSVKVSFERGCLRVL